MTDPTLLKEVLLSAGAIEMSSYEDSQSLFDFKVSPRHRVHLAFDKLLPEAQMVTISLITIDKGGDETGSVRPSYDVLRIGQCVGDLMGFLKQNGPFIAKLLPLIDPRYLVALNLN